MMQRYEKYKPSGVEWIGEIPEHWQGKKLKYLVDVIDEAIESTDFLIAVENIESGTGKLIAMNEEKNYQGNISRFNEGDTIFNKLRPYLVKVCFAERDGGCLGELLILRSKGELFNKFLFYRVFSSDFIRIVDSSTYGTKMPRANWDNFISHLFIPYADKDEQTAIASFLDEKTAQIGKLVSNKQKLIELLKEERTAIINQAVTKGINPKVKLKPSGIEWLGDIPEHWEVKKSKYIAKIISGAAFDSSSFSKMGSVKVLKIANIQHDYIDWTDTEYLPDNFAIDYERFRLLSGDIVFALTRPIISTGIKSARIVFNKNEIVLLNQRNAILRATKYLDDSFIYFVTHSSYFYHMFETNIDDTGQQPNISPISIMNFEIILPPYEEQIEISRHVEAETQRVDATISKIEKEIELLQEYRVALISEAVTGKIKVA